MLAGCSRWLIRAGKTLYIPLVVWAYTDLCPAQITCFFHGVYVAYSKVNLYACKKPQRSNNS